MKKLSLLPIFVLFGCASAIAQTKYSTYTNDRFHFSIDYPSALLKMQPPPENDDGRTFLSSDGSVEMRVWGQYNALSETLKGKYDATLKSFPDKPSYMVLGPKRYVVSGIRDGKIVYVKTLYQKGKNSDVFYTLTIEYPAADKTRWDAVVTHIANSFSIIPGADR
jgi:hypothetical protein